MKSINKENVGLYWQPQGNLSFIENKAALETVKPYIINNIHLNNYNAESGSGFLEEISKDLESDFSNCDKNYNLLIEFVKDTSLNSLVKDAATLRKILN